MNLENLSDRLRYEIVYLRLINSLRSTVEYMELAQFLGVYNYQGAGELVVGMEEAIFIEIMALPIPSIHNIRPFHYWEVATLIKGNLTAIEQKEFISFLLAKKDERKKEKQNESR